MADETEASGRPIATMAAVCAPKNGSEVISGGPGKSDRCISESPAPKLRAAVAVGRE